MYDYIIVGAGSAGCVLANRLTANPNISVLLLEAGGNDDMPELRSISLAAARGLHKTAVDWAYTTEEEPNLNNRKVDWPRGKVLGGSSSTNYMYFVRGNRHNYDHWHELGNAGWGYTDVLPYFKKAENWEYEASEYRGAGGPINVVYTSTTDSSMQHLPNVFIEAGVALGYARNADFNGASQDGFGIYQMSQYLGQRWSTADGYLRPALNRPNLTVVTESLASHILFDGTRAIGVAYLKDGEEKQVRANNEVILSGGVINSPQLLLLSGVGPADQLHTHGINVVVDLPGVGYNLQDHLVVYMSYLSDRPLSSFRNDAVAGAFVKTQADLSEPDVQYFFRAFETETGYGLNLMPILAQPKSTGHLILRSNDPRQYPAIFANYLSHETDIQVLVDGVRLARRLVQTKAFASNVAEMETIPGPQVQSDQDIMMFLRDNVQTMFHPVGTCKMGHDEMAVVDDQLRVRGVEGLRIVDASIMPTIPNTNTNSPVIMIAEKAADLITGLTQVM